jgi:hypothetical protein
MKMPEGLDDLYTHTAKSGRSGKVEKWKSRRPPAKFVESAPTLGGVDDAGNVSRFASCIVSANDGKPDALDPVAAGSAADHVVA